MMSLVRRDIMQDLNEPKELEVTVIEILIHLMRVAKNTMSRMKYITTV
jgi:hypothetical protein|nr:MAG TPA: hypothetical protein [Caudoviricetes sp.]DAP10952.1 MAG TPA: hypothetical protein [Caudoviricetes sp.]